MTTILAVNVLKKAAHLVPMLRASSPCSGVHEIAKNIQVIIYLNNLMVSW
jgi:hypothetical protein